MKKDFETKEEIMTQQEKNNAKSDT
jgi:hypothetical protein